MRHRRRTRRKEIKKQRKIIVISLFATLICFSFGYAAFSTNINLNVKGNLKDKSRVIQSWSEFANTDFHTTFYKENIVNITFLDSAVVPSNAIEFWDISETKDKGVMAYVVENDDSNNAASMYALFCDDINSETLDLSSFNTSNVASMGAMFMSGTER